MGPVLSAVLGKVAGGLVGKLFGGKKATTTTDLVALRKEAERAGFNPLTVLQNGGAAGFTSNNAPALSSQEFLAQSLAGAVETGFNGESLRNQAMLERLQLETARAELDTIRRNSAVLKERNFGYSIPRTDNVSGIDHAHTGVPALAQNNGASSGGAGIRFFGETLKPNPAFDDAEKQEQRYGDVASWIGGLGVLSGDLYTTYGPSLAAWEDRRFKQRQVKELQYIQDRKERDNSASIAAVRTGPRVSFSDWWSRASATNTRKFTAVPK